MMMYDNEMEQGIIIDWYYWYTVAIIMNFDLATCSKGNKIPIKYNAMVALSPVPPLLCAVMCVT